jgi:hypothetical protein
MPTKANIKKAMQWLVDSADENDSLFFYCPLIFTHVPGVTELI